MNFQRYIIAGLFFAGAFGCTTARPVSIQYAEKKDTVLLKPTIINNIVKTIQGEPLPPVHDTVIYQKETVLQAVPYTDTALLSSYLQKYYDQSIELESVNKMLLSMQALLLKNKGTDSQNMMFLQQRLEVKKEQAIITDKQIAATNVILYDIPKYLYFLLILAGVFSGGRYLYLRNKLRKKDGVHAER